MGLSPVYITQPVGEENINEPTDNRHYWPDAGLNPDMYPGTWHRT